jgi:hypothetical protein
LKGKKEALMNEFYAQQIKGTENQSNKQSNHNVGSKGGPIIYYCFSCGSIEHKIIYDYLHIQAIQ